VIVLHLARRLWRRIVDRQDHRQAAEDRRRRARCRSDLVTAIRARDGAVCWPARVLDVSPAGIALVVPGVLEPGEVLGIEVPGGAATACSVVLASVAHARPHGEGEWVLGCSFSEELSGADLGALGAREGQGSDLDLRASERMPCNVRAAFELVGDEPPDRHPARVLNLSLGGIGLLAERPVAAGALLNLELHGTDGPAHRTLLACVVHVSSRTDTEWVLGCSFIRELSEADLEALR
jgi:hypothetical protein